MSLTKITVPGGGMLLVSPTADRVMQFNAMAHLVWRMRRRRNTQQVSERLASRFCVEPQMVNSEVEKLVSTWTGLQLGSSVASNATPTLPQQLSTQSLNLKIEAKHFNISGPEALLVRVEKLWQSFKSSPHRDEIKIVFTQNSDLTANLQVNGKMVISNAVHEEVLGGFHQAILEVFNPKQEFAAIIHAACVAKNGKSLILAATSGSGKSTLTAQLAASGYDYYADDVVALTKHTLRSVPFPAPISVKPGAAKVLSALYPKSINVNSKVEQHLPITTRFTANHAETTLLLFPKFVPNAETHLQPISVEDALARLLNDRIFFGHPLQVENIRQFVNLLRNIKIYSLEYSNFQDAEKQIGSLLQ